MTILELLRAASSHLASRGAPSARLDVELLLAHALGKDRLGLYLAHDMPVEEPALERFRALVRRRLRHEPVAYILGEREFYGLTFKVDPRCLIPRPETEHLVDEALRFLHERARSGAPPARVVDAGTGSGCIAIAVACQGPEVRLHATDISAGALEVARANAVALAPGAELELLEGDLLDPLPADLQIDLLLSNPPYIAVSEAAGLDPDVREHEPAEALYSGDDPLSFHARLVREGVRRLAPGGAIMLELPADTAAEWRSWAGTERRFEEQIVKDLAGRARVLVLKEER